MLDETLRRLVCAIGLCAASAVSLSETVVSGQVRDINGNPLKQVLVTLSQPPGVDGAGFTTVFTDAAGRFAFGKRIRDPLRADVTVEAKALGYRMVFPEHGPAKLPPATSGTEIVELVLVLQPQRNQADMAPASAWLKAIPDSEPDKALVIRECVACHQIAHPEMRQFVRSMDDAAISRPREARKRSWQQLLTYMYGTSHEFFGDGLGIPYDYGHLDAGEARHLEPISELLSKYLPDQLDYVEYAYGAPLAVTSRTQIREYPVPNLPGQQFNVLGVREAILAGKPQSLWVVDVASDHIFKIDPETGRQSTLDVPFTGITAPHSIYGGFDGSVWLTYLFQQLHGTVNPQTGTLTLAQRKTAANDYYVSHDFATDWRRNVEIDTSGRIWFGDVASNSLGSTDLKTGETKLYQAPESLLDHGTEVHGNVRLDDLYMYGCVMTSDRKHIWYTQLNGRFGEFNTETLKYGAAVEVSPASGPRRLAITERDILYVPLFGSGQIVEYDARTHRQLSVYALPDRASAPYAVTWDTGRQVLWVATSNADLIYRFDPKDHSFGVIPLPRQRAYLRMLQVEPDTGFLVTSYALLPARAPGPRMALIVDPGDDYPPRKRDAQTAASDAVAEAVNKPALQAAQPSPPERKVTVSELAELSKKNQCVSCHSVTEPRIGPPFNAVAIRYSQQPRAVTVEVLAAKILNGGAGNWGSFPMIARDRLLSPDEARALVRAILDLRITQ